MERHSMFMNRKTLDSKNVNSPEIDIQVYEYFYQIPINIFSQCRHDYSEIYVKKQKIV